MRELATAERPRNDRDIADKENTHKQRKGFLELGDLLLSKRVGLRVMKTQQSARVVLVRLPLDQRPKTTSTTARQPAPASRSGSCLRSSLAQKKIGGRDEPSFLKVHKVVCLYMERGVDDAI